MKKVIFIILVLYGFINASSSCVNNNDDTVSCSDSNLMWIDDTNSVNSSSITNLSGAINFCENLTFPIGGFNDWRVPNVNELLSIVYITTNNPPPFIDTSVFQNTSTSIQYITSTTYSKNISDVIIIDFFQALLLNEDKNQASFLVRCVRDLP